MQDVHKHVHFIAGVPVKPMLAKPTTGVSEVLDKFQDTEFTCEYKYDGERAQIHITEVRLSPLLCVKLQVSCMQEKRPGSQLESHS